MLQITASALIFTFHYVSIKTKGDIDAGGSVTWFTFHYVSIKTTLFA